MNMYVSNLGFHVSDEDLNALFAAFGEVTSAKVITDRVTGKSRGFGFVEMPQAAEAEEAIAKLSGREVEGRTISVSVAKPRSESGGGGGRNFGGGGGGRNNRW
ncbi:RNA-binding protein [Paraflavitalea soli]|uniref:RNA-binding protein n=1 Tax=Paraflavitalea soli TaxID=2315862 RepID=A0A3B7MIJ5_9BACT|nr:RNA-binding protein [Paraflavitalea soli]AXY72990.1 RNA-binding protein [Paraflavitalea soli]